MSLPSEVAVLPQTTASKGESPKKRKCVQFEVVTVDPRGTLEDLLSAANYIHQSIQPTPLIETLHDGVIPIREELPAQVQDECTTTVEAQGTVRLSDIQPCCESTHGTLACIPDTCVPENNDPCSSNLYLAAMAKLQKIPVDTTIPIIKGNTMAHCPTDGKIAMIKVGGIEWPFCFKERNIKPIRKSKSTLTLDESSIEAMDIYGPCTTQKLFEFALSQKGFLCNPSINNRLLTNYLFEDDEEDEQEPEKKRSQKRSKKV